MTSDRLNIAMDRGGLRILFVFVAIVGALLWASRAGAVTVHLDARDSSSSVILHTGDFLRVELPASPATGFRWKVKTLDASHLELMSKEVKPDSSRLDASGNQVFVWKCISPGKAELALRYSRPSDDRTIAPAKQMEISVDVVADTLTPAASTGDIDLLLGPALEKVGTYTGTLPCGDCTSIAVELNLYAMNLKDLTGTVFSETRRYQGAPGGDRTIAGTGRWAVVHGTYADPSMTVYILAGADGGIENLKLDGDRLVPLDPQMLPIPLPAAFGYGLRLAQEPNGFPPVSGGVTGP